MQEPYRETGIKGFYVSPDPNLIQGQIMLTIEYPETRGFAWDSTWDRKNLKMGNIVDLHQRYGIRIPGAAIIPEEVEEDGLTLYWQPSSGQGLKFHIEGLSKSEEKDLAFTSQHDLSSMSLGDGAALVDKFYAESDADSEQDDGEGDTASASTSEFQGASDATAPDPNEIFLHVREINGREGKLVINTRTDSVELRKSNGPKGVLLKFRDTSRVQIYPYHNGTTFRFMNSGLSKNATKEGKTNDAPAQRVLLQDKEIFAVSGPCDAGYEEGKPGQPGFLKDRRKHNDKQMQNFINALSPFVLMRHCKEKEDTDVVISTAKQKKPEKRKT